MARRKPQYFADGWGALKSGKNRLKDWWNDAKTDGNSQPRNTVNAADDVAGDAAATQRVERQLDEHTDDVARANTTIESESGFNRNTVTEGFQDHHIISDKNPLTKNHELLELADFDLQSRANKIYLPTDATLHPTRSIHLGRHRTSVSDNLASRMDEAVALGQQNAWNTQQYAQALRSIIGQERRLLKSGQRALNIHSRPGSE